jgi:ribonuclease HIII
MPKRFDDAAEKPKALTTYTIKLDDAQMEKLRAATAARNWEQVEVPYARFAFKGPKVNVTAYTSGKVVVAGKDTEDFVQNVIEAEVTGAPQLGYDEVLHPDWYEPHAGLDESGKGDLFGPGGRRTRQQNRRGHADPQARRTHSRDRGCDRGGALHGDG